MTETLALQARHSLTDVEQKLGLLASAPANTDLLLPNQLRARNFMGTSGVLQLVITWRRRCPKGRLRLHVQTQDDEAQTRTVVERFVSQDHGLVATAVAQRVVSRRGDRDLTEMARALMEGRLDAMRSIETSTRGPKAFAMCVDRTRFAAPALMYARPVEVFVDPCAPDAVLMPEDDWAALSEKIDGRLWGGELGRKSVHSASALTGVLRELIRNTHDHARRDERNGEYERWSSARGFRIERHSVPAGQQAKGLGSEGPLVRYFGHPELAPRDGQQRFVELTVFDSGPGLAGHLLYRRLRGQRHPTLEDEDDALRNCLRTHMTTATDSLGIGLARVLTLAHEAQGFLRVRAGRLSLYRDFVSDPYRRDDRDEPFLLDWQQHRQGPQALAGVAGTSVTALLPVGHG